jgi:malonyl CoA-acyl carrier protein transacylase/acyl carrier protein/SAM-dependent methyltransferase
MMKHRTITTQASHNRINPKIPAFDQHQMSISRENIPWEASELLACINSYGAAGSNSAVMVRQKPSRKTPSAVVQLSKYPLFISAGSINTLSQYSKKLLGWLKNAKEEARSSLLASLSFNLADRGNHQLPHVLSTTVSSVRDLEARLEAAAAGSELARPSLKKRKPVVLVFGGQESDSIGLSKDVYQSSTVFRKHLDSVNNLLVSAGLNSFYPSIFETKPIQDLVTLHSALFAVQYASAKAWMDCGLTISAVVGHSFGQLTALCISGVLSLPDALRLVSGRASLMQKHWGAESGSMLFLQANRKTVDEILQVLTSEGRHLYAEIACYNGPESHVVVGSSKAIEFLQQHVANTPHLRQIRNKKLNVTHGFHSQFTEPMLPHLESLAMQLEWTAPKTSLETTDEFESNTEPNFSIVSKHTRQPVFFQQAVRRLTTKFSECTWIEAGRGSSVMQLVKNSVANSAGHAFHVPQLTSSANGQDSLTDITVDLWKNGYATQYWSFHRSQKPDYEYLSLPPIQFEKTRHWLEFKGRDLEKEKPKAELVKEVEATHELLTFLEFKDKAKNEAIFNIDPHADRFKLMLGGHVMAGQPLCPASLYFEVVARAALYLQKDTQAITFVPTVDDLIMKSPIGYSTNKKIVLTLTKLSDMPPSWSFSITTLELEGPVSQPFEHSTGKVYLKTRNDAQATREFKRYESLSGSSRYEEVMNHPDAEKMQGSHIYRAFNNVVYYGKPFHGIKEMANVGLQAAGKVRITPAPEDPADQRLTDTPMTDSFMQFAGFLVNYFNNPSFDDVFVCMNIEHIEIGGGFDPDAGEWLVHATMNEVSPTETTADAYVFDARTKKMVMSVFGLRFSKMPQASLVRILKSVNKTPANSKAPVKTVRPSAAAPVTIATTSHATQPPTAAPLVKKKVAGKRGELFQLLSNVTDVPLGELNDSTTLEDIGIDSLMATEVLNEMRATFGLTIDLSSFLFFPSLGDLVTHVNEKLGISGADEGEVISAAATPVTAAIPVESPATTRPVEASAGKRQELFQLLSEVTDFPLEELEDNTTLEDIGIDSLMATEVLNEIRAAFGLTIDLSSFLFFPSLGDLVTHVNEKLGITVEDDDGATTSSSMFSDDSLTPGTGTNTPDSTSPEELKKIEEPKAENLRPYITSAPDAFEETRFNYDKIAESIQGVKFWQKAYPYQARLVVAYIVEAFADLGCDLTKIQAGDAVPKIKALDKHTRLVRHLYHILEDGKLVISSQDKKSFVRTSVPVEPTPAENIYNETIDLFPQHTSVHKLLQAVGSELAGCLRGDRDGMQIIFGNRATKKTLEEFYEFWPLLRTPTLVLGDFLTKAFTTKATGEGKFRILELGAGTGGTTRFIINHLRQHGIEFEYVFTDLGTSLVNAAAKQLRGTEGLSFDVLDIEKSPKPEYENEFHCIIASNIVHATRNLDVSLKNARKMLRDDGVLTLVEFTQDMFWLDIVFGQFQGWWLFDDGREHALGDEKHWERKMKAAGFSEVSWSEGTAPESKTARVIAAFATGTRTVSKKAAVRGAMETVVYKQIGDLKIHADVYYPAEGEALPDKKIPVGT